jgi:general secretion pathway protein G
MRTHVRKAFTLVEILIVVVILGILAAIVVPQFTNATQDAQAGNIKAQLDTLNNQIELFRARTNGAPDLATDWDQMIDGGYIKAAPRNPFNGLSTVDTASSTTTGWVFVNNTLYATNFNNDPEDSTADDDGVFGQVTPGSTKLPA